MGKGVSIVAAGALAAGCSMYASTNRPLAEADPSRPPPRATFACPEPRGSEDVFVVLALSGGGSRAAWFASRVMLELDSIDSPLGTGSLLDEVDAISCVSGGSLAGAYYCVSAAPDARGRRVAGRPRWNRDTLEELMTRDYVLRGFLDWFWPHNVVRYWLTAFDRSDIMAGTLADNLYDRRGGADYALADLNPERPYLLVNATDATRPWRDDADEVQGRYGEPFTFTDEDFRDVLGSDVGDYALGRAVMASAAFPAAFSYMTLRDHRSPDEPRWMHVFDGGNSDNLGLLTTKRLLRQLEQRPPTAPPGQPRRPAAYVVIAVDAYTRPQGVHSRVANPRSGVDFLVDRNFLDAVDMLLTANRLNVLRQFQTAAQYAAEVQRVAEERPQVQQALGKQAEPEVAAADEAGRGGAPRVLPRAADPSDPDWEPRDLGGRLLFWHLTFESLGWEPDGTRVLDEDERALRRAVFEIPTSLSIRDEHAAVVERAVERLFRPERGARVDAIVEHLTRGAGDVAGTREP